MTISLDDGLTLQLGEHSYIHDQKIRNPSGALTHIAIGKFCSIATDLTIVGYDHHHEWITTYPFLDDAHRAVWPGTTGIPYPQASEFGSNKNRGDIAIGNDVWIGYNVKLFKGITIGNGAVIGACSLVNKSIEPYTIVAGTPARPIRKRFTDAEIAVLERIRWWDWPPGLINQYLPFLCNSRIADLERYLASDPEILRLKSEKNGSDAPALQSQNGAAKAGSSAPTKFPAIRKHVAEIHNSCHFIENALILHPRTLYHCCIPVKGKFGSTRICDYQGGPLPIDKIIESRDFYRRNLASPETTKKLHCEGCVYQKRQDWNSSYLFTNLHFNHTLLCNLECNFCVQRGMDARLMKPDYDALPVLRQMIDNQWLAPDAYIFWAGGEPTLLHDLGDCLKLAMAYGTRNEIATNGTIFSQAAYELMSPNGRLCLKTSMDCGTPETFVRMKEKDLFHQVWANLAKYASTGAEVSAKYIICHDNLDRKDLDGFVEQVRINKIRWVHVDINHNYAESEVGARHIDAAAYLQTTLQQEGVTVHCGVHSTAAIPDFNRRVQSTKVQRSNPQKPAYVDRPAIFNSTAAPVPRLSALPVAAAPIGQRNGHAPAVSTNGSRNVPSQTHPAHQPRTALDEFHAHATDYFADVVPPPLSELHLRNSRIVPNRDHILPLMPKGGICAEVGTQTGGFAKLILSILQPSKLHIYDIDYSLFDHAHFASAIEKGVVELHQGDSSTLLGTLPDRHFDFIYIDGDHSYNGVVKDLEQSSRKIKDEGWIVCNDYTIYSPLEKTKYGVYRAVNEFCLNHGFEIIYLGLHQWGYHDVALKRRKV